MNLGAVSNDARLYSTWHSVETHSTQSPQTAILYREARNTEHSQ
jgi:hypothetical protein